jgi:hypothetical protein
MRRLYTRPAISLGLSVLMCMAYGRPVVAQNPPPAELARARAVVEAGFGSSNIVVKRQAIRAMRYAGDAETFGTLQSLFGSLEPSGGQEPGFRMYCYDALESMYALAPVQTVAWLRAHNDRVLETFDLYQLFAVIGFEKIPTFDNVFYARIASGERGPDTERIITVMLAEFYLATGEERYLELLRWEPGTGDGSPEDLRFLHEHLHERGLPTAMLRYAMEDAGGVLEGRQVVDRTYTLDELLFQALLFRLGYTDAVVRHHVTAPQLRFTPTEEAVSKHGIPQPATVVVQDPEYYAPLRSARMNGAVARIYAGAATLNDARTVLEGLGSFPPRMRYRYVTVALSGPASPAGTTLRRELLTDPDVNIRRLAAESVAGEGNETGLTVQELERHARSEADAVVLSDLLDALGSRAGTTEAAAAQAVLLTFLGHDDPFVRVTAAGAILRHGAGR